MQDASVTNLYYNTGLRRMVTYHKQQLLVFYRLAYTVVLQPATHQHAYNTMGYLLQQQLVCVQGIHKSGNTQHDTQQPEIS